jgi:cob(I)alamin adenosyltransferase
MKIYTKTGDGGDTSLFGGKKVPKNSPRLTAYGTVDELNSFVGLCRSHGPGSGTDRFLARVQSDLFRVGAELASEDVPADAAYGPVGDRDVKDLEDAIDTMEAALEPIRNFILPGGHPAAAAAHAARSVCRRAERLIVELSGREAVRPVVVVYMNRLSDALFVAARTINAESKIPDVPWKSGRAGAPGKKK